MAKNNNKQKQNNNTTYHVQGDAHFHSNSDDDEKLFNRDPSYISAVCVVLAVIISFGVLIWCTIFN